MWGSSWLRFSILIASWRQVGSQCCWESRSSSFFSGRISGSQVFPAYIIAIGLGLLGIAFMARRGYVGAGAVTPALLVLVVGVIESLLAAHLTPHDFIPFMLSLWLPGIGLLVLGLVYLVASLVGKG